ncbi:MAG: ADOP family duplicated permease [Vicinamibacterales bacterium]
MSPWLPLDLTLALRRARRRPGPFLVAAVTVAVVAGAGSAVFAVANAALLRPLPFHEADRLARIYLLPPGVTDRVFGANPLHPLDFVRLRQRLTVADGPEGLWGRERAIGGDDGPESVATAGVSAGLFRLLGVAPALGRTFTDAEDRAGAPVVVLSDGLWRRRFGADPGVIGRTLDIDRVRYEVVGVMPPRFEPAYLRSELWTPLGIHEGNLPLPGATYIQNVVRLHEGVSLARLDAEVRQVLADVSDESPITLRDWQVGVWSLREAQFGPGTGPLLLLLVAVGSLALIAAVNLTHLALARALGRRTETAVRLALGARRFHLWREDLADGLLTAAAGAAVGLPLALWLVPVLLALDPSGVVRPADVALDWRVVAGALALPLVVTMGAAIGPAIRRGSRPASELRDAGRATDSRAARRTRAILVGVEAALAVVLLSAALAVFRGFEATARQDPGFDARDLYGAQLRLADAAYAEPAARVALLDALLQHVRALPGVADAATSMNLLVPGSAYVTLVYTGDPPVPGEPARTVQFRRVSDGYFRTMRIPLLEGRDFDAHDAAETEPVAIVSRRFADAWLPPGGAVDHRLRRGRPSNPPVRIVGVVGDVSDVGFGQAPEPTIYLPYRQGSNTAIPLSLFVRARGRADVMPVVRQAVLEVDPAQPMSDVVPLARFLADSVGPQRFRSLLLAGFGIAGLLLAAVGIYGVTARSVVERTREAGIRLALGGSPAGVWGVVTAGTLRAVIAGVAAGAVAAMASGRVLARMLPELRTLPPNAWWPPAVTLLGVGLAAAAIPALRAARVDPLRALRAD